MLDINLKMNFTDLRFDAGGVLAMANKWSCNQQQPVFITHVATPWLDGKHTILVT
jgi:peptidylprolyl isomerase